MKYLLILITFILVSCTNREEAENYCISKWMVLYTHDSSSSDIQDTTCESKYEKCLRKIGYTFSDLADTWGNNTNNQDTISKTMSEQVDKCLTNIK